MRNYFSSYTLIDWLVVALRIILGILFIFSGIIKLLPIEPFEMKFVEMGIANWTTAPFLARLLIAFEVLLGILLLVNYKPKISALSTLGLLLFFTIYLLIDLILNGNEGNCGCFGTLIKMTPIESIVKNLLMIPLVIGVLFMNKKELKFKPLIFIPIIILFSLTLPFILYPVDNLDAYQNANTERINYAFPTNLMPDFKIDEKKIDLSKGTYLLSFMSLNCLHCKKAAYKLFILNKQKIYPPTYLVFIGNEAMVSGFIKETKADFPYYIYNEKEFFDIAGNEVPKILLVREGIVKAKFDNVTLTEESLDKAIEAIP